MKQAKKGERIMGRESGAALVMVLFATVLLGTACIAMLAAVGASSQNNTDALSESKAYYAAESGLQAAINHLRHTPGMTYNIALNQQAAGTLPIAGPNPVGSETSYTIQITDPDDARSSTTYTATAFFATSSTAAWEAVKYFPNNSDVDRTELTFVPPTGSPVTFNHPDSSPFPELGSFRITTHGLGGTMTNVLFRIDYQMLDPRPATRSIRGTIVIDGSGNPTVRYDNYSYSLNGGSIALCPDSSCVTSGTTFADIPIAKPASGSQNTPVYAKIGPIDPYRLKVLATGFGPNGAVKRLEGVIQKNFFNDSAGGSPLQMMGPNVNFNPGPSRNMDIDGGSSPSVGVCDSTSLNTVNTAHTNGTMTPPPAITCNEVPSWLSSPITLDSLVRQLRQAAVNSNRYFPNGGPNDSTDGWGDYATGTGLTFCEGDCTFGGNITGGGILVVTGTLTTSGSPEFRGLVLVTGPGGVQRNGNGQEEFTGNIVVAPYDPNNLTSTFTMTPQYIQSGGAGDLINSTIALDDAFNGTGAISNFMLGVAEK